VGLDGPSAAEDVRELRLLLAGFRLARDTAMRALVRLVTNAILVALVAGIALKLRLFDQGP